MTASLRPPKALDPDPMPRGRHRGAQSVGPGLRERPRTLFSRTSRNAASRHLDQALSTVGHPPKPGHISQTLNARGFA
jgi:hypothetical protein